MTKSFDGAHSEMLLINAIFSNVNSENIYCDFFWSEQLSLDAIKWCVNNQSK